jgi:hypothetical protein
VICAPRPDSTLEGLECARTGKCEREPSVIVKLLSALENTVTAIWSGSTWLGILIYAGALVLSGLWLARRLNPEDEPLLWLLWFVLIPAVASVAALGLKWLLLLFVLLFSQTLAGIVWVASTFWRRGCVAQGGDAPSSRRARPRCRSSR